MKFCVSGIIIIVGLILLTRYYFVIATVISQSMSPTLEIGDRVLAIRYWPGLWLRKGQIVLIRHPKDNKTPHIKPFGFIPLIKRVVGTSGDTVLSVNPYLSKIANSTNHEKWIVPPRYFYVKGDLPVVGNDPLTWGAIPFENLLALVVIKLPWQNFNPIAPDDECLKKSSVPKT